MILPFFIYSTKDLILLEVLFFLFLIRNRINTRLNIVKLLNRLPNRARCGTRRNRRSPAHRPYRISFPFRFSLRVSHRSNVGQPEPENNIETYRTREGGEGKGDLRMY